MRILIAVFLILMVCALLFAQFISTKEYLKKDRSANKGEDYGKLFYEKKTFSYVTFLIMGAVVMMGYLFVLYAKAF